MEARKQAEIAYYDSRATARKKEGGRAQTAEDFEGFHPLVLNSYQHLYRLLAQHCPGKKVLDYGCGNGIHSLAPARQGAEVVGIDLSEESLAIARERAKEEGVEGRVSFRIMDCESLDFPDGSFDCVLDGGTFSSLDLTVAAPELKRVLKPEGVLLGIETYGHNPATNLKRKINRLIGKRTSWAASHIFNKENRKLLRQYFEKEEIWYFHLFSVFALPFLSLPGGKLLLKLLEALDSVLLKIPFLKTFAFKVVFVYSRPL